MTGHKIITIGREFGSGGHEIGQKLADKLGIPLYDHRLVSMAAEALGVRTEEAERVDESSLNTFVTGYTMTPGCIQILSMRRHIFRLLTRMFTGNRRRSSGVLRKRDRA